MNDRLDTQQVSSIRPTDASAEGPDVEDANGRILDPTVMPQGLRLIGTVSQRWAREFDKFAKVFYEIQGDREKYVMAENQPKPLDPAKCLALGECGCWLVEVNVYQDKSGKIHYQLTRNTGERSGRF